MQLSSAVTTARSPIAPLAASRDSRASDVGLIGLAVHFSRDQEIYGEGERADEVYKVVRGAARSFRVLCDGRRQICDFYLPGDLFGVEAGVERRSSAEALTDSMIVVARRSALIDEFDGGASARRLWAMAIGDLQRSQDHVLTLGRRAASERVASFLVELAARLGDCDSLELPMSRQDIADFLGLTIETVSRTFTQLQGAGLIKVTGCRSIRLCRPRALEAICA